MAKESLFYLSSIILRQKRSLPPTLEELVRAAVWLINSCACNDILYRWMAVMGRRSRTPYAKRPGWWMSSIPYCSPRNLEHCGKINSPDWFSFYWHNPRWEVIPMFHNLRKTRLSNSIWEAEQSFKYSNNCEYSSGHYAECASFAQGAVYQVWNVWYPRKTASRDTWRSSQW